MSQLLQGSGLEYSRVGTATVAIRMAAAGPAIGALARGDHPDVTVTGEARARRAL